MPRRNGTAATAHAAMGADTLARAAGSPPSKVSNLGLRLRPIARDLSITDRAYDALKNAIMGMDIYDRGEDLRLDERRLATQLGISRTPIREAIIRLEHEGLVRTVPRRGVYVMRKPKAEIVEIVKVWAALESMAARLATTDASDEEIGMLRSMFADFVDGKIEAKIDEYSEANLRFHQHIIELSHCELLRKTSENVLIHMRAIRRHTIVESRRFNRSIVDHMHIIEALERRDTGLAEALVRQHALDLAAHVTQNVHDLD